MIATRWLALVALSSTAVVVLTAMRISAALLIGPMLAAAVMANAGRTVRIAPRLFLAVQAVVGIMIARVFTTSLLLAVEQRWLVFLAAVVSVIAMASCLGFVLTRRRILPGATAVWGSFPGAATVMTLMAADYGADVRLVAFMQYYRVALVALLASAIARIMVPAAVHDGGIAQALGALIDPGHVHPVPLAATLATAAVGAAVALWLRVPAGALLGPMVLGAVAQKLGLFAIELPETLLAFSYALIGWSIGMRFDHAAVAAAKHALLRVTLALIALVGGCALLSIGLSWATGVDPLTAYLAMSPGGADSVAIIATSVPKVDVAFVMALQVSRFLVILLCGPTLARWVTRWAEWRPARRS